MDNTSAVQVTSPSSNIPPPPKPNHKLIFLLGGLIILIAGFGTYYLVKSNSKLPLKACTMEAKLCPDGSSVGRTGSNCDFAPCPTPADPTANWKTYKDTTLGYSIMYPADWTLNSNPNVAQTNVINKGRSVSVTWSQHAADQGNAGGCASVCNFSAKDGAYNWVLLKQLPQTTDNSGFIIRASTIQDSPSNRAIIDQILSTFKFLDQESDNSVSQECGVCGAQGIHNVNGAVCTPGLICKKGITTSLSYCVKQDSSTEICEKSY